MRKCEHGATISRLRFRRGDPGSGAAGLVAATRAAECGARVILLEKNRRPGVKILISGGTRCNITNARGLRELSVVSGPIDPNYDRAQSRGIRAIQQAFGDNGAFLSPALRRFDVDATVRMFEEAGVATKIEGNGKIFPLSDRATDVLDALTRRLERSGASLRCQSPVLEVERTAADSGESFAFKIKVPDSRIAARRVIIAVGGLVPGLRHDRRRLCDRAWVWPYNRRTKTGAGSDPRRGGLGCRLERPHPSRRDRVGLFWSGRPAPGTARGRAFCSLWSHGPGNSRRQPSRRAVGRFRATGTPPGPDADSLSGRARSWSSNLQPAGPALVDHAVARGPATPADRVHVVGRGDSGESHGPGPITPRTPAIADRVIKGLSLPILGTLGFEKAEVTSGGVALDEVDPKTLESRLVPGLYFAGEVLDLDGLIGGYNFQAAWSTGWLAGETAATRG